MSDKSAAAEKICFGCGALRVKCTSECEYQPLFNPNNLSKADFVLLKQNSDIEKIHDTLYSMESATDKQDFTESQLYEIKNRKDYPVGGSKLKHKLDMAAIEEKHKQEMKDLTEAHEKVVNLQDEMHKMEMLAVKKRAADEVAAAIASHESLQAVVEKNDGNRVSDSEPTPGSAAALQAEQARILGEATVDKTGVKNEDEMKS